MRTSKAVGAGFLGVLFAVSLVILPLQISSGMATNLVISQVYGGGGNVGSTFTHDFIEVFNPTSAAVDVTGWSVQYASNTGTTWQVTALSGTIQPGQYYLVRQAQGAGGTTPLPTPDAIGGVNMSATNGKVALVFSTTALAGSCPLASTVDFAGYGNANCFEGAGAMPTLSNTTSGQRLNNGCTDTNNNNADFATAAVNPRNTASPLNPCGTTNPTGLGAASPASLMAGEATLLTVSVTPGANPDSTGLAVNADLSEIGGSAMQMFFDDGSNGDATPGDNVFSFSATVAIGTAPGAKMLPFTVTDAEMRSGNGNINLTVESPVAATGLVISQLYGGGGNAGATLTHDFIEIFNRTNAAISVSGWSVQYAWAAGTSWQVTPLGGSIPAGGYFLVQQAQGAGGTTPLPAPDAMGSIAMAAGSGKVALVSTTTALAGTCPLGGNVVDFAGYGTANCFEGAGAAPTLSNTTAALRLGDGCQDTDNNSADFTSGGPAPRNSASPLNNCTALKATGAANPERLGAGDTTLLTVTVTPGAMPASTGISVAGDLSSIGGAASQMFFDDGTNGDATASDNVFSFLATVDPSATFGEKTIPVSVSDDQARSVMLDISVRVVQTFTIPQIQGTGATSPLAGEDVRTGGIVTARTSNGFFMQMADADADGDPQTSEGIFVFTGSAPAVALGDRVNVTGCVAEFAPAADPVPQPLTEIACMPSVGVASSGNPLPAAVTLTSADLTPGGGLMQLERFEGMRVHIMSLTVVAPTEGSVSETTATSTSNGVFFGVLTGTARPFREPGIAVVELAPPSAPAGVPLFDNNPERIRVFSRGQVGAMNIDVATGMTLDNLTGVLDSGFARTYSVLPDPEPVAVGDMPAATPVPVPAINEYTVGSFNMERLFNDINDPGISEPVLTAAAFAARLNKASLAIRDVMRSPDIIGVQEAENLATLQALADKLNADTLAAGGSNPMYEAYLEEGNDIGGIDVGFLVKRARVVVLSVVQEGKLATFTNPTTGAQDILNDRPPLVGQFEVMSPIGPPVRVTVIVNHLRSLNGVTDVGPSGDRVRAKRAAQAEFLANLIQTRQAADANERIVSIGDYNAFEFNDGYVDVMGTIRGVPTSAAEVTVASADLVNPDLTNLLGMLPAGERYSFVFDGSAQVLDHVLVSDSLKDMVSRFHYARANADFPEILRNLSDRPERSSDHDMPVAYFLFVPIDVLIDIKPGDAQNTINLKSNGVLPVAILGTPDFDPGTVDSATVTLAGAPVRRHGNPYAVSKAKGKANGLGMPMASLVDVNGDGRLDLLLHFETSALELESTDTVAVLKGMTFDGKFIRGQDTVRIVPAPETPGPTSAPGRGRGR